MPALSRSSSSSPGGTRLRRAAAVLVGTGLLAVACSSGASPLRPSRATGPGHPTRILNIVAGENFWGSIVSQLAGQSGRVTSVVTDPNADPHNYESSADNARAFADADYIVLNGAGYDAWADKLLSANPSATRKVFTVATLLGQKVGDNPHLWYNPDFVTKAADQMTADLKSLDPADAGYFDGQRQALAAAFAPVDARLAAIRSTFAGTPVAATESIFVPLADFLGLKVVSPVEFMNAVAEGNDPPAPSVAAFQDLLTKKEAKVLVFNQQTSTVTTTNLKKLATNHDIAVVGVTETIQPPDARFQDWFGAELIDLQNALNADALTGASPTTTTGG
jgi:zinc/manganese transport system substrate-binding protein